MTMYRLKIGGVYFTPHCKVDLFLTKWCSTWMAMTICLSLFTTKQRANCASDSSQSSENANNCQQTATILGFCATSKLPKRHSISSTSLKTSEREILSWSGKLSTSAKKDFSLLRECFSRSRDVSFLCLKWIRQGLHPTTAGSSSWGAFAPHLFL